MGRDSEEFDTAVQQYRLRAYYLALQLVGDREDAMDVTQDAFIRLHQNWHRRDPTKSFTSWFYAIVRNRAIDLLRQRKSRREVASDELPRIDGNPGPGILAEQSELKARVWQAIDQLPLRQREALILRDLHGLSYGEIAETLGVAPGTVASRIHDARATLREKLRRLL